MTADGQAESRADQPETGEGPDGTTEFRSTPRQLRNLLIAIAIGLGVTVVALPIAVVAKSAGAAKIAAFGGIWDVTSLYAYLFYAVARTKFGPAGISGRNLGGRFEYQWSQISIVAWREYTARGITTYSVILTTTGGDRIRLGTPAPGGIVGDPAFATKYARIRRTWQAATGRSGAEPANGRTGAETDTQSIWTRGIILLTAGLSVQIIAAVVIATMVSVYGPAFAAHQRRGETGMFVSELPNCGQPTCTWLGTFTAAGSVKYATLAPGGPFIDQAGIKVPAVGSGAQDTVYPKGGGTAWKVPAAGLAVASALVLAILAAELAALIRRRRRLRNPPRLPR